MSMAVFLPSVCLSAKCLSALFATLSACRSARPCVLLLTFEVASDLVAICPTVLLLVKDFLFYCWTPTLHENVVVVGTP